MQPAITRVFTRLAWVCALALTCVSSWASIAQASAIWAASPWETSASPVFRRAALPAGFSPVGMLQDRSGMIWIGTQTGLVRWDGQQFQRGFGDLGKHDDLRTSFITALYEDDAGLIWIGTSGNGVLRLDPRTGAISVIAAGPQGLSGPQVNAMAADRKGGLWVSTDQGLNRVDLATGRVQQESEQTVPLGLLKDVNQTALLLDRRGDLWIAMSHGLFVLRAGAPVFELVPLQAGDRPAEDLTGLIEDGAGRLWIRTLTSGVFVRDPATGVVRRVLDSERQGQPLLEQLTAMADAGNGEIWLGTTKGIVAADVATLTARRLGNDQAGISAHDIWLLFRDRSGLMWVGGVESLAATNPAQRAVSTWYAGGALQTGGTTAMVPAILARADGSVWASEQHAGIGIIAPDRRTVRRLPTERGRPRHALPEDNINTMVEGPDGRVFIGATNDLYVASANGSRVERLEVPDMPKARLMELCVTGDRLWIGSNNGLNYLELSPRKPAGKRVVPDHYVNRLYCASDDELFVGTRLGLFRYRPSTGVMDQPWPPTPPGQAGLSNGTITGIARDRRGNLWVAIYGGGVCRIAPGVQGSQGQVRCLGHQEGITDNAANAVALDAQDNAWVSTDTGLVRIGADTLKVTPLQQIDGVGVQAHIEGAVATTAEGDLIFGGKGLTVVHPAQYQPWTYKAPLVLTAVSEGQQPSGEIRLGPSTRSVQMSFALLDYSAPEQVRYAYRLAGLEEAWTDAPTESRIARYTNIPPGNYTFEVKARNRVGDWTTQRWPLRVERAWHETHQFHAAAGVAALLLLWGVLRLRTQWLVHRATLLREQVAQRTQELLLRTEELQQRTEQLEASRQALRELGAHNALSLEEERKRVARELHDELGQQLVAMRMEMSVLKARAEAGQAPDSGQWVQMRDRVDLLTASMRSLVQALRPPAMDGGLAPALEWLAAEYRRISGATCEVAVDPQVRMLKPEVKTMVFRVAQESLNNIARHARATHVRLQLQSSDDGWHLHVVDDGIGFDTGHPSRGFGLLSMEERAQLMGGTLRIESHPGKGTHVHLHLPLSAASDAEPT
ncbi:two-component regulator propeller domain-containing protein [Roseateles sp.]|uniref:sensor histidine kinase n=1 Tax=Roseateles sp. TaxID=1971397 RepID=UPI003263B087